MSRINDHQVRLEKILTDLPLIPLFTPSSLDSALMVADALQETGFKGLEVTLRSENALDIIEVLCQRFPELVIGIGTVKTPEQVTRSHNAGADFIVSPGYSDQVAMACLEYDIPYLPGAITPTEVSNLEQNGHRFIKFFPADAFNAINVLKNYAAVYPDINFCATGGVSHKNVANYLNLKNVVSVGMSALLPQDIIESRRREDLEKHLETFTISHVPLRAV